MCNEARRCKSLVQWFHISEPTLGQTNLICCFSSAPASTSNTPLQLSLLPFASGTPPINAINNHVMSRETSLMASAHGHLNNEVMNNNRPPAPKFRKWLMRNNKSRLSGLMHWYIPVLLTLSAHARREGYCSCHVYVCMCVRSNLPPHTLESQTRYQRIHRNTGTILYFANFAKNGSFKSYGVICSPRAAPAS